MSLQTASPSSDFSRHSGNSRGASSDRGAVSLRDALVRDELHLSRERLLKNIRFWQESIKGKNVSDPAALNVSRWYWKESRSHSYQAPNWRVPPERSALFAKFRSDEYYHLKNLVEIVGRTIIEETLRASGADVTVMVTSDSDDVFAGVDFIVEERKPNGSKSYYGFDLAVSENPAYLEGKRERTRTKCREFNQFMRWPKTAEGNDRSIPRKVFDIPPRVMSGFLPEYMKRVAAGTPPTAKETLELFEAAQERNVAITKMKTQSRVAAVLH